MILVWNFTLILLLYSVTAILEHGFCNLANKIQEKVKTILNEELLANKDHVIQRRGWLSSKPGSFHVSETHDNLTISPPKAIVKFPTY